MRLPGHHRHTAGSPQAHLALVGLVAPPAVGRQPLDGVFLFSLPFQWDDFRENLHERYVPYRKLGRNLTEI